MAKKRPGQRATRAKKTAIKERPEQGKLPQKSNKNRGNTTPRIGKYTIILPRPVSRTYNPYKLNAVFPKEQIRSIKYLANGSHTVRYLVSKCTFVKQISYSVEKLMELIN